MGKKLALIAVLIALLACALASGALAAQFTSKIGIRFVEATITDPPTPLSDGTDIDPTGPPGDGADDTGLNPTEPPEDGAKGTCKAAQWAWISRPQSQCE